MSGSAPPDPGTPPDGQSTGDPGRYRSLFDRVALGVVYLARDGRIVDANAAAQDILGLTLDQMQGRTPMDPRWRSIHEDGSPFPGHEHPAMRALADGQPVRGVVMGVVHATDSEPRWLLIDAFPEFEPGGAGPCSVFATFTDITDRRRAEAQAQQWERVFACTELALAIGSVRDNTFIDVNPAFARQHGFTVEELIGRSILDISAPDVRDAHRRRISQIDATAHHVFETTHQRKDGTAFPVLMDVTIVRDFQQEPYLRIACALDITDRKRDEQALRESERTLRSLFDAIPESVFLMDTDGTILAANTTFASRLDRAVDDVVGSNVYTLLPPAIADRRRGLVAEAVRTGRASVFEDERDGRRLHHHVCPVPNLDGAVSRVVAFAVDTTERHQMDVALRESNERYRHMVETSFDWIWEVDASMRYTFVSDHVRDLLGYEPDEVIGRTPFEFMLDDEARRVASLAEAFIAGRRPFAALENVNRHKSGRTVVLESSAAPILGPDGEFLGYRGMDRDITERKHLEAQLRQTGKLEAIGQLAGGVAHDFNNILAATMMHISLLQTQHDLNDETRAALAELDLEVQRAASLTRQLLMFSRRSVLAVRTLDLNELISNLLKMLGRLIGEHIDLRFDVRTRLPSVEADAGMLEQVLMNLVVNARDAMPRGGRVTITTSVVHLDAEQARAHPSRLAGSFVCVSVTDTGEGMDADTLTRVFEPFFTTKEAGRGTGLGLATVHGIVAQHRGWVEADSRVRHGSTFRVFLPAGAQADAGASVTPAVEVIRGGQEGVLLVEDDSAVRRMVARSLAGLGYRVLEAANGQEAMRLWQTHAAEVDLLFTDMVMPEGMTGLELCERLLATRPGLRTIISSGYSSEIVHSGVPTKTGIVYLPKPYELKALARVVRECLDRR